MSSPSGLGVPALEEGSDDVCYGELIIIGKDKTEGAAYDIFDDVTIGREKGSDIRVNLKTVSRVHAKITIDVNGRCEITNYSSTNPCILNGTQLEGKETSTLLEHGDIFTIGERDFKYKNEELLYANQQGNSKHVPILETIGEENSENISMSRNSVSRVATPGSIDKVAVKLMSSEKKAQPTPKDMIRKLKTPLRDAINAKRISFGGVAEMPALEEVVESNKKETVEEVVLDNASVKRSLKTPVREAINARRKSYGPSAASPVVEKKAANTEAETLKRVLKTPLRLAILARRETVDKPKPDEEAPTLVMAARRLKTPLKEAIHKRRKSINGIRSAIREAKEEAIALSTCRDVMVINVNAPASRRVSLAQSELSVEDVDMEDIHDRRASAATQYATWEQDVTMNMSMSMSMSLDDSRMTIGTSSNCGQDEVMSPGRAEQEQLALIEASIMKIAIDAMAVEFERAGESSVDAYILAEEAFMANPSAFTGEFSEEDEALSCPVSPMVGQFSQEEIMKLASASTTPAKVAAPRGAQSLMKSVKKSGANSVLDLDPQLVEAVSGTDELVSALSDKEVAVIDNYAVMLKDSTTMTTEESYATALDSYLRGLKEARKVSPFSPMVNHRISPFSPIVDKQIRDDANACASPAAKGSVLVAPNTPSSATSRVMDRDLVDKYMFLIMRESGVDEGTAYSASLDAYLADKSHFRSHVGHLLQNVHVSFDYLPDSNTPLSALRMQVPVSVLKSAAKGEGKPRGRVVSFVGEAVVEAVDALVASPAQSPAAGMAKKVSTGLKKLATRAGTPHANKTDLNDIINDIASAVKRIALADDDEDDEEEQEEEDSSEPSTPVIASAAPKSSSKSGANRKKVAMCLVGDAVQSALACIAAAADAEESESVSPQTAVQVPMPASVKKRSTPQREAFVDLVQNLTTAVSEAVEAGALVEEQPDQKQEKVPPVMKSLSKTTKKRRSLAGHFVASAMQSAFDALTSSALAVDAASPAAAPTSGQSAPSPAVLAVKSVKKEALASLVESMALAVEAAAEAVEREEPLVTEPLVAKVSTPVQPKSDVKRTKQSARKSLLASAKKSIATPVKSPMSVSKPGSAAPSATKSIVAAAAVAESSAKKESPAKTPVKKSSKRTKAMKSPLPSKNSPSAALPTKKAKREPHEKEEGGNLPVPPPYGARDKPASLPSAAVKNACKKGGKSAKAKKEEVVVVVEEEEEEEEATAILCDGCDAEHFLDEVGLSEIPEGDWFCAKCEAKKAKAAAKKPAPKKKAAAKKSSIPAPSRKSTRKK